MKDYMTAKEAADKLGYEYTHFTRLLKQGKVRGAFRWEGYAVPKNVSREDIEVGHAGRPKKISEGS